ncbi:hypothetical protein H0H93_011415 [Arthromyces matolae]|nr:hypothetical protein H0H93_011415 [Arthromyces matolae]
MMTSLRDILNPEDVRRRTVRLILNMDQGSNTTSEVASSPGTSSPLSETSDIYPAEDSGYQDHKLHANCPNSLSCLPDTDGRPQHTLPVILRCAILGSPRQRLTIREIYAAMEDKYAYYKTAGPTWKQSVRHHLSLNRLFERQPRPDTDPGFGSYWTVNLAAPPGTKRPRKRNRQVKEGTDGLPLPPKKKGRPRKSVETEQLYFLEGDEENKHITPSVSAMAHSEHIYDGWSLQIDGLGNKREQEDTYISRDEYESEEEIVHPLDRRSSLAASGLGTYQPSRTPQTFSLPPLSSFQSHDSIIDALHADLSAMRRQSSDAISLSLRLSDQVLQAQAETSRMRDALQTAQQLLDEETKKRVELEQALHTEEKRRIKAEEALKSFHTHLPHSDQTFL